jgi:hypothetical protein
MILDQNLDADLSVWHVGIINEQSPLNAKALCDPGDNDDVATERSHCFALLRVCGKMPEKLESAEE